MNERDRPGAPPAPSRGRVALLVLLSIAGLTSIAFTKIALFVLVGSLLAFLSLGQRPARVLQVLTGVAALSSLIGFVRFIVIEAMPGIVQGGTLASGQTAVSRLREILFAQDALRRSGAIDPDGDGVGSAAFLGEMIGQVGLRGGERLTPPVLERYPQLVETALGPAAEIAGYYFIVCLPKRGGGYTARPGEPVDDEAAERHFVAYAWPSSDGRGLLEAYFIDQHERILFARSGAPAGRRERVGPDRPPACDDALAARTRETWQVWRGKRPRATLPGDRP